MITATVKGNIGKEPVTTTTTGGKVMTKFSIASSPYTKKGAPKKPPTWVNCTCWKEGVVQGFNKGNYVEVVGTLTLDEYNGKQYLNLNVTSIAAASYSSATHSSSPPEGQVAALELPELSSGDSENMDIPF